MPASTAYPEILIKNNNLYTSDRFGNTGTRISENVSNAYWSEDQSIFLVTKLNGRVEVADRHGNVVRAICEGAKDARFDKGTDIQVRMDNGQNKVFDKYGNMIRTL